MNLRGALALVLPMLVPLAGCGDKNSPWSDYLLTPRGALEWPNHQHAAAVTARGTILMFDNGTNRDGPVEEGVPASEKYSRAVEYEIDEEAMEWPAGGWHVYRAQRIPSLYGAGS